MCFVLAAFTPASANAQLIQTLVGTGTAGYSGDGGPAASAYLNNPFGIAVDSSGNVYIADFGNSRVRVVNTGASPIVLANVTIQPGAIATVAGNGTAGYSGDGGPATSAMLNSPAGVAVDSAGTIYIADTSNYRVRKVAANGTISTIAGTGVLPYTGDGVAANASLIPWGLAVDHSGNLYIADVYNNGIRVINTGASSIILAGHNIPPGYIATLAGTGAFGSLGDDGAAISAQLSNPYGVAVDATGSVYIADTYNRRIRVVNTGTNPVTVATVTIQPGCIGTIAGDGNYGFRSSGPALFAQFADLDGVALDRLGNIYINDLENQRIRLVDRLTGMIRTTAGTGALGYNGDGIPAITASLSYTRTTAVDSAGNVYFSDQQNNERIRVLPASSIVSAITTPNTTSFVVGTPGSFVISANYWPTPAFHLTGTLPAGMTFVDNRDGSAAIAGTPQAGSDGVYHLTVTASNGAVADVVQNLTITVYTAGGSPASSTAALIATDIQIQGNWQGAIGTDGYDLPNVGAQIPAYAAISVQNASTIAFLTGPTDIRTPQIPGSSSRDAAAWSSTQSFSFDLNITGGSHRFAMYFLDLDFSGRVESVQINDAATGFPLYATTMSNFPYGTYLEWSISGHVIITVTNISGPNAVVSSVFFGAPNFVTVYPSGMALSAGQTQQFSVTGSSVQPVNWGVSPASGAGTISSTGLYTAPASISAAQTVTITATSVSPVYSGQATLTLSSIPLPPPSGLALWWTFDNANSTGEFITDSSGNGGTGEVFGLPAAVQGKINQAFSFNGANSYVAMNSNEQSPVSFTNSLTLAAWINTSPTGLLQTIVSKYSAVGGGWGYDFRVNTTGYLEVLLGSNDIQSGANKATDTILVADGQWHHVAAVITAGQDIRFYIDGVLKSTVAIQSAANGDQAANLNAGNNPAVSQTYFAGIIDELRIYNRALSASEVNVVFVLANGSPVVTVTVTPQNPFVTQGQTQQFAAQVTNSGSTAVTWGISPVFGSISAAGLYTAPANVASAQQVTVTATLQSDNSKFGSTTMTVVPPVTVSISPTSASLTQGQTQQFTPTVMNAANTSVTWSFLPMVGTLSSLGLYTAPAVLTNPQMITVTATSVADPSKLASATVTLIAPIAAPGFSPPGGTYTSGQPVSLSTTTPNATIRYTLDGSTPTQTFGTIYSAPINVSANTTIKAVAYVSGVPSGSVGSQTYVINAGGVSWFSNFWPGRKLIALDHTQVQGSSDFANFPVLISLPADSNLAASAQSNGYDILFTAADGVTQLHHEIEYYNNANGELVVWVLVPAVSHTQDTPLYIYYGNPSVANQQTPTLVWDSTFDGVWHMSEGTSTNRDSTANANHASKVAPNGPSQATGQIDGAQSFDGTSDQDLAPAVNGLNAYPLTITLWTKTGQNCSGSGLCVLVGKYAGNSLNGYSLHLDGTHLKAWYFANNTNYTYGGGNGVDAGVISDNTLHHVAMVIGPTGMSLYLDGQLKATQPWTGSPAADSSPRNLYFGNNPTPGGLNFQGVLDEIRVATAARSADWIATEFNNQGSGSFFSLGAQETGAGNVTVTTVPAGLALTVDSTPCTAPCAFQWTPGTNHTIATSSPQAGTAGTQYAFQSWSDSGAISHSVSTPNSAATFTATFNTQFYLTTTANPSAGGTISPASGWYNSGAVVPVSATPNPNYQFSGFTGALSGTTTPQNVTLNGPQTVTANFVSNVGMTVTTNPSGLSLTVDNTPCTAPCQVQWNPGSMHTVVASSPQAGPTGTQYVFASWSDGQPASHTIIAPATPTTYTATYTTQFSLTTFAGPNGTISPASGWFNANSNVQVMATPSPNYQFAGFSGALSGTTNPQSLTMTGALSVSASFVFATNQWAHWKTITIPPGNVSGSADLSNFPVLISLSADANLAASAQANGNDIFFTAADGITKLNHEIEYYNGGTGQFVAWVQVPVLSHTQNTALFMYYGNSSATSQQNPAGVWDPNYKGVFHMSETSGSQNRDSTANTNNGAKVSASDPFPVAGQVDGAQSFNGASDQVDVPNSAALNDYPMTISLWTKTGQNCSGAGLCTLVGKYAGSSLNGYSLHLDGTHLKVWYFGNSGNYTYPGGNGMDAGVIADNATHYVVFMIGGSGASIYVDNRLEASQTWTGAPTATSSPRDLYFGNNPTPGGLYYNGVLDEIRVSNITRSTDWMTTEYNNQKSPGAFFTLGPEQSSGGGGTIVVTLNTSPQGLQVTADGNTCTAPCVVQWTPSTNHTIAISSPQNGPAGTQYLFSSWSDGGLQSHSVSPASTTSYTATFSTQYFLTTAVNPANGGTISPASGWYNATQVVQVSALAANNFTFSGFSGALSGTTSPQAVTMSGPQSVTANFTSNGGWYNSAWVHRKLITVYGTQVSGSSDLTNFPLLVSITSDANLASFAQSNGNDILFTASDGVTKLNHEIESYTSATGQLTAWVQLQTLLHVQNTTVYVYYGNPSALNQQNPPGVWDATHKGVWHMNETTGTLNHDSTANANNGTKVSANNPLPAAGQIAGAQNFNGSNDQVDVPNAAVLNTYPMTVSFWTKTNLTCPSSGLCALLSKYGSSSANGFSLHLDGARLKAWYFGDGSDYTYPGGNGIDAGLLNDNAMHYVAMVVSAGGTSIYVDGALKASQTWTGTPKADTSTRDLYFGNNPTNGFLGYRGLIDEVRVAGAARTSGWIVTEYNNQNSPATFLTVGPQQ